MTSRTDATRPYTRGDTQPRLLITILVAGLAAGLSLLVAVTSGSLTESRSACPSRRSPTRFPPDLHLLGPDLRSHHRR
jgi:hypothetical protein